MTEPKITEGALLESLDCKICLKKVRNPTQLHCNHVFCKLCLETLLVFNDDDEDNDDNEGSARIVCPLKCHLNTLLFSHQTLDDFLISQQVENITEVVVSSEDRHQCSSYNCTGRISIYCCGKTLCDACFTEHEKREDLNHQNKLDIQLDDRHQDNELKVICGVHASPCSHLCMDGALLCVYCCHRDLLHKCHEKNSVKHEVHLFRKLLEKEKHENDIVAECKTKTKDSFETVKGRFKRLLKSRKEKSLQCYKDLFVREEENMLAKLDEVFETHLCEYPDNLNFLSFLNHVLKRNDLVIAIEKNTILDKIRKTRDKVPLYCEEVSLSENFDYLSEKPLGDLLVNRSGNGLLDSAMSTLRCDVTSQDDVTDEDDDKRTNKQITKLTKMLKEYESKMASLTEKNLKLKRLVEARNTPFDNVINGGGMWTALHLCDNYSDLCSSSSDGDEKDEEFGGGDDLPTDVVASTVGNEETKKCSGKKQNGFVETFTSPCAEALYSFKGEDTRDLTLGVGQMITHVEGINQFWSKGKSEGREGIFPTSYVKMISIPNGEQHNFCGVNVNGFDVW